MASYLIFLFIICIINANCHLADVTQNEKQSLINDLKSTKEWLFESLKSKQINQFDQFPPQCITPCQSIGYTNYMCLHSSTICYCWNDETYTICGYGFYVDSYSCACETCPYGCAVCYDSLTCQTCYSGYTLNDGTCSDVYQCSDGCDSNSCDTLTGECSLCQLGYVLTNAECVSLVDAFQGFCWRYKADSNSNDIMNPQPDGTFSGWYNQHTWSVYGDSLCITSTDNAHLFNGCTTAENFSNNGQKIYWSTAKNGDGKYFAQISC